MELYYELLITADERNEKTTHGPFTMSVERTGTRPRFHFKFASPEQQIPQSMNLRRPSTCICTNLQPTPPVDSRAW